MYARRKFFLNFQRIIFTKINKHILTKVIKPKPITKSLIFVLLQLEGSECY